MYTTDPELNRGNAFTPSTMSMESQIIYKLGSLEASLNSMARRLDDRLDGMHRDMTEKYTDGAKEVAALKVVVEHNKEELDKIKEWKTIISAKIAVYSAAIAIVAAAIVPVILKTLGRIFVG